MKLYRFLLLWGLLALGSLSRSYGQFATWSRSLPPGITTGSVTGARSVTDADGNTYVVGQYYAALTLGAVTLPATGSTGTTPNYDLFLVKINPAGLFQWALPVSSPRQESLRALAIDPVGNVYMAIGSDSLNTSGSGPLTFGGQTTRERGNLLARVSPAGSVSMLTVLDRGQVVNGNTFNLTLAPDAVGNCFVSVSTTGGEGFGPFTFPFGRAGGIIFRVDAAGTMTLVRTLEGNTGSFVQLSDMKLGANGDLYCAGYLDGTAVLGTSPSVIISPPANTYTGVYVARFSTTGVARWGMVSSYPGSGALALNSRNMELAVSPTGSVYMAGYASDSTFSLGGVAIGKGAYVVKLSSAGAAQWARASKTLTSGSSYFYDAEYLRLGIDAAGNLYRMSIMNAASFIFGNQTVRHPIPPLPGQTSYRTAAYALSYDSVGTARWARTATGYVGAAPTTQGGYLHYDGGMGCDRNGSVYCLLLATTASRTSRLQFDGELLEAGYHVLRLDPAGRLSGTVYLDQNGNGTRDAGEGPFPVSQVVEDATLSRTYSSDATTGEYNFYGLPGAAYSISVPTPPLYYTLAAPTVRTGTFPAVGQTTSGINFGLVPTSNQADLSLTLTPYSALRAGFTSRYRVTVANVGTTTVAAATATLTLDPAASYVNSTGGGTYTAAARTVDWPITNLAPFARVAFDVQFSLPTTAAVGALIQTSATVPLAGDVAPANNTVTDTRPIIGPYDPNSIQVNYSRLTTTQLAAGLPLDYLIQFQNMGTDTAFTATIRDTLNLRQLTGSSLQLVAQSHNCTWSLTSNGLLTIHFYNIKLPARNTDVIRSQGFVRFRVQPRATLAAGDIIPNRANIFFDYAAPVVTNTATTAVLLPTAVLNSRPALAWSSYPNPTTETLSIEAELPTAGLLQLQLLDVLGRPVQQRQLQAAAGAFRQTLDLGSQPPGLYVLRLTLPDGRSSTRTVERK